VRHLSLNDEGDIRARNPTHPFCVLLNTTVVFAIFAHAVNHIALRERLEAERFSIERIRRDGGKNKWDKIAELVR